jgi:DNA-binding transcriptional LysR family regulator
MTAAAVGTGEHPPGDVDFGIVIDPGQVSDLACESVLSEPFLLLCRDDDPLAALPDVRWQSLQGANLVYRIMPRAAAR